MQQEVWELVGEDSRAGGGRASPAWGRDHKGLKETEINSSTIMLCSMTNEAKEGIILNLESVILKYY